MIIVTGRVHMRSSYATRGSPRIVKSREFILFYIGGFVMKKEKIVSVVKGLVTKTYYLNPEIKKELRIEDDAYANNSFLDVIEFGSARVIYKYVKGGSNKFIVDDERQENFYAECIRGLDCYDDIFWEDPVDNAIEWLRPFVKVSRQTGKPILVEERDVKTLTYRISFDFLTKKLELSTKCLNRALTSHIYLDIAEYPNYYTICIYEMFEDCKKELFRLPKRLYNKTLTYQDALNIAIDNIKGSEILLIHFGANVGLM